MSKAATDPRVTIGSKVSVKTTLGDTYQGKIFAFDARSATLTLVEEIKNTTTNVNKRVIKTEFIADIKVISRSSESEPGKLVMPKQEVCEERLKRALAQAQKSEKMLGAGVSAHAQALMDHLAKMYECAWEGKTIVVREFQIKISAPYGQKNCVAPRGANSALAMSQIKRIVTGVQSKFR